jgi:5-methyltetrahydrofolate--homocysteine methyltransferase
MMTPGLVAKLRRSVKGPLICKPNAGVPVIGDDQLAHYPMSPREFAAIVSDCIKMGAGIIGGCCGTAPGFIEAAVKTIRG